MRSVHDHYGDRGRCVIGIVGGGDRGGGQLAVLHDHWRTLVHAAVAEDVERRSEDFVPTEE